MAKRKRGEAQEDVGNHPQEKKTRTDDLRKTQTLPSAQASSANESETVFKGIVENPSTEAAKLARRKAKHERRLRKAQEKQKPSLNTSVEGSNKQTETAALKKTEDEANRPGHNKAKTDKKVSQASGNRDQTEDPEGKTDSTKPSKAQGKAISNISGEVSPSQIEEAKFVHKEKKRRERASRNARELAAHTHNGVQEYPDTSLPKLRRSSKGKDSLGRNLSDQVPGVQIDSTRDRTINPDHRSVSRLSTEAITTKQERRRLKRVQKAKNKTKETDSASVVVGDQKSEGRQASAVTQHVTDYLPDTIAKASSEPSVTEQAAKNERRSKKIERRALAKAQKHDLTVSAIDSKSAKEKEDVRVTQERNPNSQEEKSTVDVPEDPGKKEKSVIRRERKNRKLGIETLPLTKAHESPSWKVSEPTGGQMIDVDPIFSGDEQYLLIAFYTCIAVYSTSTSLVIRKLQTGKGNRINGITICPSNQERLYVASASGGIELWDWQEARKLTQWNVKGRPAYLTAIQESEDGGEDLVFVTSQLGDLSWQISAQAARASGSNGDMQSHTIFTQQQTLSSIRAVEHGKVIIAVSGAQLTLGVCTDTGVPNLSDMKHTWHTITCPEWITSLDVRTGGDSNQKQKFGGLLALPSIDVVIGGLRGSIHIYQDLLNRLIDCETASQKGKTEELTSRRLHWHRNAVLTVKWSSDGNYLISGGQETVLVLWQLDSGRKEMLPHLGAPIESVVVSPQGSSYGIRLADNSAMILSTSEMQPTFSASGIQASLTGNSQQLLPLLPAVDNLNPEMRRVIQSSPPACVSPSQPGQLLLAVPPQTSSRTSITTNQNASYLQTFDIASAHQSARQAIARTKITNLNMGPESNTLEEPNVTQIATSHNGQWLATVDEWMPPRRDLSSLAFNQDREQEEQTFRQEIYLKFWFWNDDSKVWELVSRIDNPHASEKGDAYEGGRVLAMAPNPSSTSFATLGEDGVLKTWRPTIRRRNGLDMKGKDGKVLVNWHRHWSTLLESPDLSTAKDKRPNAHFAYSPDSSVIAAGLETLSSAPIYLIDSFTGEIQSVQTGLYTGPLLGLGILDKYLVILSHSLILWDLVNDELHYCTDLQLPTLSPAKLAAFCHLAIDVQRKTFAVTVPEIKSIKRETTMRSQIAVFDTAEQDPLFVDSLPNPITILLPAAGSKGYYAIDAAAEVRTLVPGQSLQGVPMELPTIEEAPQRGLNNIFGNGSQEKGKLALLAENTKTLARDAETDGNNTMVVSRDKLVEVFDQGPAYAMPPVAELFEQVAVLFNGRRESAAVSST